MVTRTFIDKCTTIVKNSEENFGLNPVAMLNHGFATSRVLLHFDVEHLRELYNDKTYPDVTKMKHILRMTNCASIDERTFKYFIPSNDQNLVKKRATSFEILCFKVPIKWDEGVGFDYSSDVWFTGSNAFSIEGCNWYQAYNGCDWAEEGIYSTDTLTKEYVKFSNNEPDIVVARQHFDHGNEDLEIDLTDYVNSLIVNGGHNYGVGLCFTPMTEESASTLTQYVGFFTNNTNTFFEPFLETKYDDCIEDDRNKFYLGKTNRLYLYSNIGGSLENLDYMPTCTIDDVSYEVKQQTKGVYYVDVKFSKEDYKKDTIVSDVWSNLSYNGDKIDDVEQEFVTLAPETFFDMSGNVGLNEKYSATIVGIDDYEEIVSNDVRMVKVVFRKKYTNGEYVTINGAKYRLYVMSGDKEVDVIDWDNIHSTYGCNYFMLDTNTLVPNEYHIDIKVNIGNELKVFKDEIKFTITKNSQLKK